MTEPLDEMGRFLDRASEKFEGVYPGMQERIDGLAAQGIGREITLQLLSGRDPATGKQQPIPGGG